MNSVSRIQTMPTGARVSSDQTSSGNVASFVKDLSRLSSHKFYLALSFDWLIIGLATYASRSVQSFWAYLVAVVVIAGRQHALFTLMHEGAHRRISNSSWLNNFVSDWFVAYPIFFETQTYRENHMRHHLYLNTERDPDWVRKSNLPEWRFPMKKSDFFKTLCAYFKGLGIRELSTILKTFSGFLPIEKLIAKETCKRGLTRLAYYVLTIGLVTFLTDTKLFLFYWLGPYVFLTLVFQRVRSVAEHFGLERETDYNSSRNVLASKIERFFIGPHNVGYHLDHHLYPSVPFYNLPKLHAVLIENENYRRQAHQNSSYLVPSEHSVLEDLCQIR